MNPLKKLLQQTAVYGLSSVVGRFLNYLLVPIYTRVFIKEEYGEVTELYAYVGFLIVLLTYGMETAFFRYFNKEKNNTKVFSTAAISLVTTTSVFLIVGLLFSGSVAEVIRYASHKEYIIYFVLILGFDVLGALPFAKLRVENKASRFAWIKLTEIGINIGLNLFFLVACRNVEFLKPLYNENIGVGYIFISNLVASAVKIFLLLPDYKGIGNGFDKKLYRRLIIFAWPLIFVGLAGNANEMLDRVLLKYLLPFDLNTNMQHLGVYGACYKLSIFMTLFVQAFRYAGEPFFFNQSNNQNAKAIYAIVLKYFVIAGALMFLTIALFLNVFKYFIGKSFWEGLHVVPILLLANLLLGVLVNLNIWYKLTNKTKIGAWVAIVGAGITIGLNVWWIPIFGYTGSAWATLICYTIMVLITYLLGRKYYPINYPIRKILLFVGAAIGLFMIKMLFFSKIESQALEIIINFSLLITYGAIVVFFEKKQFLAILKRR